MASFSVVLFTAAPAALAAEGAGAFVKVDGRECLLRSVEMFLNRDNIKQIHVVVAEEQMEEAKRKYGGHLGFSGVKLIAGGQQWMDQIAAAGEKISVECSHVILHDAARPAVAYSDLEALMDEVEKHPVAVMTTPIRAGLIETEESGRPIALRPPQRFAQVVTPWAMRKDKFLEMAKSKREPAAAEMWLVRSSSLNIRVGSAGDAGLARVMINMLPKPKIKGPENPFEEAQW
ncbi:MAG TPA: 2-C-methyl-D-erythritol 4-phosphate cytidylyltransferase [Tepidisphaeraceae bacterium]|jgi:2-C-methyl-D-erythritol 4-phosphate cytidylyltransferase|nr:2-C-methyl-D-erythritol 4-phosphate cytidylyltransferase [Tepidisphaeraceae bacterium]